MARLSGDRYADPIIICNDEHRFIIAEQVREIGVPDARIVLEPMCRNTAPAAAVSASLTEKSGADSVFLVAPSDHAILDASAFQRAIGQYREAQFTPEGKPISAGEWASRADEWLPSAAERAHVISLMQRVVEPGKFAGWIAPPRRGINGQPLNFAYVHLS